MSLVIDASVGLKWVLPEADSPLAYELFAAGEPLLLPDFWLNEAANMLWLSVRRRRMSAAAARAGLTRLREVAPVVPTHDMELHEVAVEIGLTVNHSPYDILYVAFAIATGARGLVLVDRLFEAAIGRHPDPRVAGLALPLDRWKAVH